MNNISTNGHRNATVTRLSILSNEIRLIEDLYCLNDLHAASGGNPKHKPGNFLRIDQTQSLIEEINRCSYLSIAVNTRRGGDNQGTYVCKELVYAYAMWISPKFNLEVIRAFDSLSKAPAFDPSKLSRTDILKMALDSEQKASELEHKVEELAPKAEFHDKVAVAPDAISISEAAKILGIGRNTLMALLRRMGLVTRRNEPYQAKIVAGLMEVKLGSFNHPEHGLKQSITPLITGKGLIRLQQLQIEAAGGVQ